MGAFSSSAFSSGAFSSGAFEIDIETPVVEYVPQDRWVPSGPAPNFGGYNVKRKRRGKRDEILFLRP